ncbi:hypothetical protein CTKA_00980 [Chthonomonas calidirosea]|nr:hypothetical protein CTKA_00980 [Chthonomonas calidirosea]
MRCTEHFSEGLPRALCTIFINVSEQGKVPPSGNHHIIPLSAMLLISQNASRHPLDTWVQLLSTELPL